MMTGLYDFFQDLRFSVRQLFKERTVTFVLLATIALAIAVNAIAFGTVDTFLHPLPVNQPEQLVVITAETRGGDLVSNYRFSYRTLEDIREQPGPLRDVFAFSVQIDGLSTGGKATQLFTSAVTGNYFSALGLAPAIGRLFEPGEGETSGASLTLVLGYSFWQKRFAGDPGVIGRLVRIDGRNATIIGVTPKKFHGTAFGLDMDGYMPLRSLMNPDRELFTNRADRQLTVLGRLQHGVSVQQAQVSMNVLAQRLEQQYPATDKGIGIRLTPEPLTRPVPLPAMAVALPLIRIVLLFLAGVVLLLACMNVANILLVRATVREREMAIRVALGSGRGRLVRQMLTESLVLAALGAAGGNVLGRWAGTAFVGSLAITPDVPVFVDSTSDGRVIAYSLAIALLTAAVTGIWPALRASHAHPRAALHDAGPGHSGAPHRQRLRSLLIVGQVAASLVLLICATLFARSLQNAQRVNLGFVPDHVLNARMNPVWAGYDMQRTNEFYRELERRVKAWPEVRSASLAFSVPFSPYNAGQTVYVEGRPASPGEQPPMIACNYVDAGYFDTLEVSILRGRAFRESDTETSPKVAIINQTMASKYWPNEDPIGKRFRTDSPDSPLREVVGVARDGKYVAIFESPLPYFYFPLTQEYQSMRVLQLRASVPPESLRTRLDQEIRGMDSDMPVVDLQTMTQALAGFQGYMIFRIGAMQAGVLGMLGLVLATVGVYGVVSYGATQRTREIGIRMALGATPRGILTFILGQGAWMVASGVAVGFIAALGLSRLIAGFLLLVSATDPFTFASVPILLGLTALLACYIPARRAMKVDPLVALRHE